MRPFFVSDDVRREKEQPNQDKQTKRPRAVKQESRTKGAKKRIKERTKGKFCRTIDKTKGKIRNIF